MSSLFDKNILGSNFIKMSAFGWPYVINVHENYISVVIIVGMAILPRPAKVVGRGWAIFCPCTPGQGEDGFSIFIPAPH